MHYLPDVVMMPGMVTEANSAKKHLLETLLQESMVMVTLDARGDGVGVPDNLAEDPQLRLNLSLRFGLPMVVGDEAIEATLTFGGVPHPCRLPWTSIYMFYSHATGQPFVFPSDIPQDLAPQGENRSNGPALSVVDGEGDTGFNEEETRQATTAPRRGHLRVVK